MRIYTVTYASFFFFFSGADVILIISSPRGESLRFEPLLARSNNRHFFRALMTYFISSRCPEDGLKMTAGERTNEHDLRVKDPKNHTPRKLTQCSSVFREGGCGFGIRIIHSSCCYSGWRLGDSSGPCLFLSRDESCPKVVNSNCEK